MNELLDVGARCAGLLALLTWSGAGAVDSPPSRTVVFGYGLPSVSIASARVIGIPEARNPHRQSLFRVDSNAPALWIDGKLVVFHSWENIWRATGPRLDSLSSDQLTRFQTPTFNYLWYWLESAFRQNGTIYGFYHQEVPNVCPPRKNAAAPGYPVAAKIGAVRSRDEGLTWENVGWVIEGKDSELKCESGSPWYAGGAGDFDAIPDRSGKYYYFYFANYSTDRAEQGLGVARLAAADLDAPVGHLQRWYQGNWTEPGIGGHSTPTFPSFVDIYRPDGQTFWGPVVHWNRYLQKYVMILNRTRDASWSTEGIYLSFGDDVSNPNGWSAPVKIIDRTEAIRGDSSRPRWNGWYASLLGMGPGETDKEAGQTVRLFIDGVSRWEITFHQPGSR